MTTEFRVIAIISAFNEGDIISPVIGHLVENRVDVYLIDNHSTDDTVDHAAQWLGKGLLDIELFPQCREQASKFEWSAILRRKEELAMTLQADWFIHHDADEIRESPWPGLNLKEAIQWVDRLGYNSIDFHVLNFPPTDDGFRAGDDPKTYFNYNEDAADFDVVQRKAWKATETRVSLAAAGGHEARFLDRRLFPIKFLMRHYPIRGQQHGVQKIFQERKLRFLDSERAEGWHRQYDDVLDQSHCFLKDPASLIPFNLDRARFELMAPDQLIHNFTAIQAERDELRRHATNLEIDRRELKQHAGNLAKECEELNRHAANLERELAAINSSVVWRTANVMRRLLIGKRAVWSTAQEKEVPREPTPIFSSLDIPGDGGLTTVTETCLLRGWTCSSEGIEIVTVSIDGNQVCQFSPEIERPDVVLVHPAIPGSGRSGFDVTIQLGSI